MKRTDLKGLIAIGCGAYNAKRMNEARMRVVSCDEIRLRIEKKY
jgi:hypothetical protein